MSFKDMGSSRKNLITALMLGDMYRKNMGLLVTEEVKLMIDGEEFHYNGPEIRIKEKSIVAFGNTKEDSVNFEIVKINIDKKEAQLKKVQIFKAKVTDGVVHEICVVATDKKEAFIKLKEYCKELGYKRILSMNPSEIFEPLVN